MVHLFKCYLNPQEHPAVLAVCEDQIRRVVDKQGIKYLASLTADYGFTCIQQFVQALGQCDDLDVTEVHESESIDELSGKPIYTHIDIEFTCGAYHLYQNIYNSLLQVYACDIDISLFHD